MFDLSRQGPVYVLTMNAGENRFNETSVAALNRALDEVENEQGACALVTTGTGKFYSNGLDLDWLGSDQCKDRPAFVGAVQRLLARMLAFPRPTVAAANGHVFAAGAMLLLAHDFSVMRSDRGYFCLPEVDIGIPFTVGMTALIAAKLPQPAFHEACTTGKRYGGADATKAGIVSEAAGEADVLPRAIARATELAAKDRSTLAAIKRVLYAPALAALSSGT
ncbi:MAG TPA: enoyl-CoA hydratase/isomerase family protein [Polyangiaceae bacterium]|jgi:enoyl-CoA hydratase/carnithine racemase|nr:enoyl-CoA hydratase/isomerase family protein [Polyangiaceae bacterium]